MNAIFTIPGLSSQYEIRVEKMSETYYTYNLIQLSTGLVRACGSRRTLVTAMYAAHNELLEQVAIAEEFRANGVVVGSGGK